MPASAIRWLATLFFTLGIAIPAQAWLTTQDVLTQGEARFHGASVVGSEGRRGADHSSVKRASRSKKGLMSGRARTSTHIKLRTRPNYMRPMTEKPRGSSVDRGGSTYNPPGMWMRGSQFAKPSGRIALGAPGRPGSFGSRAKLNMVERLSMTLSGKHPMRGNGRAFGKQAPRKGGIRRGVRG